MPRSKSALKRQALSKRKSERNQALRSTLKSAIKKTERALVTDASENKELVKSTTRMIDKMVSKGVIHKNQAARRKSRLVKKQS